MKYNNIDPITIGLKIKDIQRSVLAPINNILTEQKGSDTLYDFGAYLGANVINITFHCKTAKTKTELQTVMRKAAAWLFPTDRKAKKLELDQDSGLYYIAKVQGDTALSEILSYGMFTASFICKYPFKFGAEISSAKIGVFSFTRGSIAYNEAGVSVPINKPRYFTMGTETGLMIEEASPKNLAYNPNFDTTTALMPTQWSERKLLVSSGTHFTGGGIYRATLTALTDPLGSFGIVEVSGSQHVLLLTDIFSVSVKARVVSGNCQARLSIAMMDTAYAPITTSAASQNTSSTEWTELKIENINYANQKVLGISLTAHGNGVATNLGVVEFKQPILEFGKYVHTFKLAEDQMAENAIVDISGLIMPLNFGMGITFRPDFGSAGVQIGIINHTMCSLYYNWNNFISIYIDATDKKIKCKRVIEGTIVDFNPFPAAAPVFTRNSIIKAYITKTGSSFRFVVKIDTAAAVEATVSDPRTDAIFTKVYIGSQNGTMFYANSILKYFKLDDNPSAENYLV